jgi:hypothetical protein
LSFFILQNFTHDISLSFFILVEKFNPKEKIATALVKTFFCAFHFHKISLMGFALLMLTESARTLSSAVLN